jgi:vacuolar-type H+-ATPase subunit F/Vma7
MDNTQHSPVYIGDELGATGYRLAGALGFVCADGDDLDALLDKALASAPLVLLASGAASRLPAARLHTLLRNSQPLVIVVPDFGSTTAPPDLAGWLRGQLGMAS